MTTHVQIAEDLAHKSLNGDDLNEPMRHRYAMVAQVHATLGLIEAVEKMTRRIPFVPDFTA